VGSEEIKRRRSVAICSKNFHTIVTLDIWTEMPLIFPTPLKLYYGPSKDTQQENEKQGSGNRNATPVFNE